MRNFDHLQPSRTLDILLTSLPVSFIKKIRKRAEFTFIPCLIHILGDFCVASLVVFLLTLQEGREFMFISFRYLSTNKGIYLLCTCWVFPPIILSFWVEISKKFSLFDLTLHMFGPFPSFFGIFLMVLVLFGRFGPFISVVFLLNLLH